MVITITSPGYKYSSELQKTSSETTKAARTQSLTKDAPSLQEFQQILAEKMAEQGNYKTQNVSYGSAIRGCSAQNASNASTINGTTAQSASGADQSASVDTGLGFTVPSSLKSIYQRAAQKYGVDEKILETVGYNESRFQSNATSSAGAMGIMQLMPATARAYGVTNAYDPEQNIMAGAHLISDNLKSFNGNLDLAIGAYAVGGGAIRRNGNQLTASAQKYVNKFRRYYN
ncbi:MAG: hypothetical protein DUD27_03365 [Lachnospiraceae bacterium]|uniref:Transglycosylase SLT domain-containing protein n=1 Tax=Candidatus Weimeria bifida TaxID=2599074 RepID=A0A6N7IY77_9FIRM|nr:hypothetical protein [Candidatus Weimeria bifida]RRF96659.1 MAG: hypothetical protein DUD27_03365 [Lachnospiraceae bacterium]